MRIKVSNVRRIDMGAVSIVADVDLGDGAVTIHGVRLVVGVGHVLIVGLPARQSPGGNWERHIDLDKRILADVLAALIEAEGAAR